MSKSLMNPNLSNRGNFSDIPNNCYFMVKFLIIYKKSNIFFQ
jgi:hypothetical protein